MSARRVVAPAAAAAQAREWTRAGERVVLAIGSFDLLGASHARSLAAARARGDRLIALVRDDAAVALRLGAGRPVIEAAERARLVAARRGVDRVVVAGEREAREMVRLVRSEAAPGSPQVPIETDPALAAPGAGEGAALPDLVARVRARAGPAG